MQLAVVSQQMENCKMITDMKRIVRVFLMMAFAVMPVMASAQKTSDPEGYVTYSLPSTTIVLDVEAVQESFYAGPYARYAEKYLGIKVRQKDETSYQITRVGVSSFVEADLNRRYALEVMKEAPDASFLNLTSAGLISFADANYNEERVWTFPYEGKADFSNKGVSSNLKSEATTLYRNERTKSAYSKVSFQQNMVVEKSLEQKAAEAAQMIVTLRDHRLQIVTGDTDATYSGEAMGAAVAELTKLEEEYLSLFTGYSEYQDQKMSFEVVPSAERESQMYVAFRVSDAAGLMPADNMSGKPVVMEIIPQEIVVPETDDENKSKMAAKKAAKKIEQMKKVHYLIPAVCTIKVKEGAELLVQSRIPIYQLGILSSVPVNTTLQ